MRWLILPALAAGLVGCVQDRGGYYDGPRGGYYDPPPRSSYPQSRWDSGGGDQCPFRTRRGTVTGYKPQGKDRCCVMTREGESCQRLE
ncbi:MAG TPA: hypothetical protein VJR58_29825 [Vineibacter sp.]|nr:hypothetical protein [Vineibacter sp.]